MGFKNLQKCVIKLEALKMLKRIDIEIDPCLEMGEIQRRVYAAGGPALLFTRAKGSNFPMLGNLYGTIERTRFIFSDTLKLLEMLVKLKVNPSDIIKKPVSLLKAAPSLLNLLPKYVSSGRSNECIGKISDIPQLISWRNDGGAFLTLPQIYTQSPENPGYRNGNLGMYRVQLSGNDYVQNKEIGIHYQIHRGIGIHHTEAAKAGSDLHVNVFVGGPPALTVAAVMPLPEGMPELSFANLLAGERVALVKGKSPLPFPAEADFVITGRIDPKQTKPEGPFGDHLGYYSLKHPFPFIKVDAVYHRKDAILPFTTVGRPPQEDTSFGEFIHELTGELIPQVLHGVKAVHAVDAAGVHPLLLAIGSERYTPYSEESRPMELLTQANAILGQGQLSLAKYLFIASDSDNPPDIHNIADFLKHIIERVDWRRDIHFQTETTIDTLDYSGNRINSGSKAVIAARGKKIRKLATEIPTELKLPETFSSPAICIPGVMALKGCKYIAGEYADTPSDIKLLADTLSQSISDGIPLIIVTDDSNFAASSLNNFLWVTFTRSNPASDIYGVNSSIWQKHWGCSGALIIDARIKPHHAPPLEMDKSITEKVDSLAAKGGALEGMY